MPTEHTGENLGEVAILILAAGSSSRMGQSKQLLPINGEPLLRKTVRVALAVKNSTVCVVLGVEEAAHRNALATLPVEIVVNNNWQEGIGGTLKTGLLHVMSTLPELALLVLMVCDQPYVTSAYLEKLLDAYRANRSSIVASRYANTVGVPVIFNKMHFAELLRLDDKQRAKEIILKHIKSVAQIDFPEGVIDLDTMEDYKAFVDKGHSNWHD